MHDFEYVPKVEWEPVKQELLTIIHKLQDEIRSQFTFQYRFVGSSERNMITRDRNSNIGFDFDVNLEVNDPKENYSATEIRTILRHGLNKVNHPYGFPLYGYDHAEDSTRVLTIKVKDPRRACILHSCDFCIINECSNGRQQYIRYNKSQNSYTWEYQPMGYQELPKKIDWVKQQCLWQQVRDLYLYKKNLNVNPTKRSRAIFAETVNEIWQQNT